MMNFFVFGIVATHLLESVLVGALEQRVCWYTSRTVEGLSVHHAETSPNYADKLDHGSGLVEGSSRTCPKSYYCYAFWKSNQNNHSDGIIIIDQGCWKSSGNEQDCENSSCVTSRRPFKALSDANFCCCKGDFCNGNVTQRYYPEEVEVLPVPSEKTVGRSYIIIIVAVLVFFILTASCPPAFILVFRRLDKNKKKENIKCYSDSVQLMESGISHNSNFSVENLKLEEIIGQGRYGCVWKGSVGDQEVAVKIFQSHHKNYFYNELDIYCVPFMTHPSLLSYFGCDERLGDDGNTEYLLFLSLVPQGTLQDYLNSNVLDWSTFCKMALSIAKGVAYLHSDIIKGEKCKPCISHRDLNTKNILVKEDLSCVICDLGFATKISGSKYYYNGEELHAEIRSINDVGTLRYMSPEVLEGAVNLRDCETALKQIDVYALGLILWELSTRCKDFYPTGMQCSPYRLPFEAEIGHPTFEQMQVLVCKHKARPLFPNLWRDSPAVRTVKETIEDCWDQDAEARLTALCVEERLHDLSGVSERQKICLYSSSVSPAPRSSLIQKESQNILIVSENKDEESCTAGSTVETLLAVTPANPKNSNFYKGVSSSVQPYQGRNPCLERNLMLPIDCDSNSEDLVDKSRKGIMSNPLDVCANEYFNAYPTDSTLDNIMNPIYTGYTNLSEPLLRTNAPIPFLQNVKVDHPVPKLVNIPRAMNQGRKISWKNFKRIFAGKSKLEDISPQVDCCVKTNLIQNENYLYPSTPTTSLEPKLETEVLISNGKLETKINKDGSTSPSSVKKPGAHIDLIDTDVISHLGMQNNNRPNTLSLVKNTDVSGRFIERNFCNVNKFLMNTDLIKVKQETEKVDNFSKPSSSSLSETALDVNSEGNNFSELPKMKLLPSETKLGKEYDCSDEVKCKLHSLFKSDVRKSSEERDVLKHGENVCVESADKINSTIEESENVIKLKNPSLRVKTPGDMPLAMRKLRGSKNFARFSLYDDRMMSGYYDNDTIYCSANETINNGDIFNSFRNIKINFNV